MKQFLFQKIYQLEFRQFKIKDGNFQRVNRQY